MITRVLPEPGPGQDQVVPVGSRRRRALRFVELARQVLAQPIVQGRLENNLPHATAPAAEQTMEAPLHE